jgi:hypothetical protein
LMERTAVGKYPLKVVLLLSLEMKI